MHLTDRTSRFLSDHLVLFGLTLYKKVFYYIYTFGPLLLLQLIIQTR